VNDDGDTVPAELALKSVVRRVTGAGYFSVSSWMMIAVQVPGAAW